MGKILSVAVIGVGSRGGDTYGTYANAMKEKYKVSALCDLRKQRLDRFGKEFGVDPELCFTDEEVFFQEKRGDVLIVATQDGDHVRHAIRGLELGYDLLMEKPITASRDACQKLLDAQKKTGGKVLVCHVLRYAPAFLKCAELLQKGEIGRLVTINALERVGYWHQAHSYVRGNWRRAEETTPMVLAKTCHDLDLLQFYAGDRCVSVTSVGELTYFKKECAPKNSAERCVDCSLKHSCPYSAERIYIEDWKARENREDCWPSNVIAAAPLTEEKIREAIEKGPYGRCVFRCDNDVVDHQITQMLFENGVKATLTMTGFTAKGGRRIDFFGTMGEIVLDESEDRVTLMKFGEAPVEYRISELIKKGANGHGGGDAQLMEDLYDVLTSEKEGETALEKSVESNLMGIAAEESRKKDGALVLVHEN